MFLYISLQYKTNSNFKLKKMKQSNFKSNISQLQERIMRFLFSFQLLAIGLLLPALFAIGIHTMAPKQDKEVIKTEVASDAMPANTHILTNQNG
jgi:hypothetical protein